VSVPYETLLVLAEKLLGFAAHAEMGEFFAM
jgi:hypothetical protein